MRYVKQLGKIVLLLSLLSISGRHAFAQQWVYYPLTDFAHFGNVEECASVADTLGHIHHYFTTLRSFPEPPHNDCPLYYLRTDYYGHVLTDTVRINPFNTGSAGAGDLAALGDGTHSWCTFRAQTAGPGSPIALYVTERDSGGNEVYPARLLSYPYYPYGPGGYGAAAALTVGDTQIHWIGMTPPENGFRYNRLTAAGDTLMWARPIGGTQYGMYGPSLVVSPQDGRPWVGMTVDGPDGTFDGIRLVRFNEDTSQVVYHPMANSGLAVYPGGFGLDGAGTVHLISGNDTAHTAYVILDSTMQQIREWRTISRTLDCLPKLRVDSAGNSLMVCGLAPGVSWAYRRADGTWPHPPSLLDPDMGGSNFSIVAMDSERFAFTCRASLLEEGSHLVFYLYTYGFPPDTTPNQAAEPAREQSRMMSIVAYPSPFSSSLCLQLPDCRNRTLVLYDILGRAVWTRAVADGVSDLSVNDERLGMLPSGTYFLTLRGSSYIVPKYIVHIK